MNISWVFAGIFCLMLIGACIHVSRLKKDRSAKHRLEIFLLWVIVTAGIFGMLKFYGHLFHPEVYARFLGWKPHTAWQYETATFNLLIGTLGFLSIWIRDTFWTATVISITLRDWEAVFSHYLEFIRHYDFAMGNIGLFVYIEILHPILAIALLVAYSNIKKIPKKL